MSAPLEDWQREILTRDRLAAQTLVSEIANLLYDDLLAKDRERRFFEDGGDFAQKIAEAAAAKVARIEARAREGQP